MSKMHCIVEIVNAFVLICLAYVAEAGLVVSFTDLDLDAGQLGGYITWIESPIDTDVTHFTVFLSAAGLTSRQAIGSALAAQNGINGPLTLPADTDMASWVYFTVYANINSTEVPGTPGTLLIYDAIASGSSIIFIDEDLDQLELGGHISWTPSGDVSRVAGYRVFFGEDAYGFGKHLLGGCKVGTNTISVPQDYPLENYTHILVYANSTFAERTTASASVIQDSVVSFDVDFVDLDMDEFEIAGDVTWTASGDTSSVSYYRVYLAEDSAGTGKVPYPSHIISGARSSNFIPPSTPTNTSFFTHIVVYAASVSNEQTTPGSKPIVDASVGPVQSLNFNDLDPNPLKLGGSVTWSKPPGALPSGLGNWEVHTGINAFGNRQGNQLLGSVPVNTYHLNISVSWSVSDPTPTHILVYANGAEYQNIPTAFSIIDSQGSPVSSVSFLDLDLDDGQIGGTIEWTEPGDTSLVTHYAIYLSESASTPEIQIAQDLPVGTNMVALPPDISSTLLDGPGKYSYILVTWNTSLAELTSSVGAAALQDNAASVSSIQFTDEEPLADRIQGEVTWTIPANPSIVKQYSVYVANDGAGADRQQVGMNVSGGDSSNFTIYQQVLGGRTRLLVYAWSTLAEQTTPAGFLIADYIEGYAQGNACWCGGFDVRTVVHNGDLWRAGGYNGDRLVNDLPNQVSDRVCSASPHDFRNDVQVRRSQGGETGRWRVIADHAPGAASRAPWLGRNGFGFLSFDSKLWVIAGRGPSAFLSDVWKSVDGLTWTVATNTAQFGTRTDFGAVVFNGKMLVMGGFKNNLLNDVWSSVDGSAWSVVVATAEWKGRRDFGVAVFHKELWLLGGYDGAIQSDIWRSTDGASWTMETSAAPFGPRWGFGVAVHGGQLWVIGGFKYRLTKYYYRQPYQRHWSPGGTITEVPYQSTRLALADVKLTGGSNTPVVVTYIKPQGMAASSGVKVGDVLAEVTYRGQPKDATVFRTLPAGGLSTVTRGNVILGFKDPKSEDPTQTLGIRPDRYLLEHSPDYPMDIWNTNGTAGWKFLDHHWFTGDTGCRDSFAVAEVSHTKSTAAGHGGLLLAVFNAAGEELYRTGPVWMNLSHIPLPR